MLLTRIIGKPTGSQIGSATRSRGRGARAPSASPRACPRPRASRYRARRRGGVRHWGSATLGAPCPSSYRLEFVAPWLSGREVACPRPDHRCLAKSIHMFGGSIIGGATRPPSRPTSAFCPCSGLVAPVAPSKGGAGRLPFLPAPAPFGCGCCHSPPRWGRAVGAAVAAPLFCRLPLCFAVCVQGGFPPRVPCGVCPPCPRPDCPLAVVLFYRLPHRATRPLFCVVGLRPPMLVTPSPARGAVCPPPPPPECFS